MPKTPAKSSTDLLAELTGAWRLWLLGALAGALLAWAAFALFPPDFQARATVVVDNNLEEAWVYFPDRQLFQFLTRETERLEELAWSDAVMQSVSAQLGGAVTNLRSGVLSLSQPADGGWHFYANHPDPQLAQQLASSWATAFVEAAQQAVEASPDLQAARQALEAELLQTQPNEERLTELLAQISRVAEQTRGVSPYTELSIAQSANLPTERQVSLATYLLVGSAVGALLVPLWVAFSPRRT
jgi:capsular polysaccharide biosynthesis protein